MNILITKWSAVISRVTFYEKPYYSTSEYIFQGTQDSVFSLRKIEDSEGQTTFPNNLTAISYMYWEIQNTSFEVCLINSYVDPFCINPNDLLQ